ncbi:UNVERIFIED_CONTAM: hypothetical protein GTU68_015911 [Idotea baltica]|nr:hypothetical protein [Idotea baltica]
MAARVIKDEKQRCAWCLSSELEQSYHDSEWGIAERDKERLFECLCLEGAQAGLSWLTILKKREGYRAAFHNFSLEKIASFGEADIERLVKNPEIVRHRQKIASVVTNARAAIAIEESGSDLTKFFWKFVDGRTRVNTFSHMEELPSSSVESTAMSKDLKKLGFAFVGPTTCYSFMQATGMVHDHLTSCFRYSKGIKK